MKKWTVLLLTAAMAALAACSVREEADGMRLWFPVALTSAARPVSQAMDWESFDQDEITVDSLVNALLGGPEDDRLAPIFRSGTQMLGWTVDRGTLYLDLSDAYSDLSGVDLTLADCCIAQTLCQLDEVDQVCITVNGAPVAARVRQFFSPDDMIFTGAEDQPRQVSAELYFPRAMGKGLGFETRELTLTEDDDLYAMIAQALMEGPSDPDLHTLVPEGAALLSVGVDDGVCFVNFSGEFLTLAPESEAEQNLLLYSVVDTMGNLGAVRAVQLLVDGERIPEFGGQEASVPLEPDFGLLSGN